MANDSVSVSEREREGEKKKERETHCRIDKEKCHTIKSQ